MARCAVLETFVIGFVLLNFHVHFVAARLLLANGFAEDSIGILHLLQLLLHFPQLFRLFLNRGIRNCHTQSLRLILCLIYVIRTINRINTRQILRLLLRLPKWPLLINSCHQLLMHFPILFNLLLRELKGLMQILTLIIPFLLFFLKLWFVQFYDFLQFLVILLL